MSKNMEYHSQARHWNHRVKKKASWLWKKAHGLLFNLFFVIVFVQLLSHVWFFATTWTTTCQASLSFTISRSLLKLMSIKSVMPSNHLILCCPLHLLPWVFPSITVFNLSHQVGKVLELQSLDISCSWTTLWQIPA